MENMHMSRHFISGVITLATLALGPVTFAQATESTRKPQPAQEPAAQRQNLSAEQQMQKLQDQIDELRADHQALIDQLTALRATAAKEKAPATVKAIETIINKQKDTFQDRLRQLQVRQQPLRKMIRDSSGGADRAARGSRKAPEFQLRNFVDDKTVKLSDYSGKIVVLEWINLDCPFSMYHHKTKHTMVDLADKYKDKGVVWLAINSTASTTPQANVNFAKEQKLPYPILDDRSGRVGRLYGAQKTPHMFIIDQRRTIVYEGAIDNAAMGEISAGSRIVNYVDQALAALTSGQEVPTPMTLPYGCSVKYAAP
jgi:peroxiredoxin